MPPMRAVLETRQKAAAVQVKQLEAELERVRAALADAEEVHRRRVIGLEQYLEALAEEDAPADEPNEMTRRKRVGSRRAVPHRRHATGVRELSPDYQALMAPRSTREATGSGPGRQRSCWAGTARPLPVSKVRGLG